MTRAAGGFPDWAHKRPGDETKWQRPTGVMSAFGRAIRATFCRNRHEPCGGLASAGLPPTTNTTAATVAANRQASAGSNTKMIDLINGCFAVASGLMAIENLRCLYRDRFVSGSSLWPPAFFNAWGVWSAYFYFDLNQWASFSGSLLSLTVNTIWIAMAVHFRKITDDHEMRRVRPYLPQRHAAARMSKVRCAVKANPSRPGTIP
jgi:hypothetical protein